MPPICSAFHTSNTSGSRFWSAIGFIPDMASADSWENSSGLISLIKISARAPICSYLKSARVWSKERQIVLYSNSLCLFVSLASWSDLRFSLKISYGALNFFGFEELIMSRDCYRCSCGVKSWLMWKIIIFRHISLLFSGLAMSLIWFFA